MKAVFLNIIALALFCAAAAAGGVLTQEAVLFQIAAQWLVNELWFDAYLVPALLMQLFGRKGEGHEQRRSSRAARWTSFCLLLLPALLFGVLALIEGATGGALGSWLGLPLGSALYVCSFAGFGLLFILTLCTGAAPLSVQAAFENFVDGKLEDATAQMREEAEAAAAVPPPAPTPLPQLLSTVADLPAIPDRHSPLYATHLRDFAGKQEPGETVLVETAPAGVVPAPGEGQGYLFAALFSAVGLAVLCLAYSLQQGGLEAQGNVSLAATLMYVMGAAFVLITLPLWLQPLRWRRGLKGIDYFITDRRLLIYRGSELHIRKWSEPCVLHLEPRAGSCGDVEVIRKGLGYNILRGFFKRWAGVGEAEARASFDKGRFRNGKDMQTQALINVEEAAAVHALIERLFAAAQQKG